MAATATTGFPTITARTLCSATTATTGSRSREFAAGDVIDAFGGAGDDYFSIDSDQGNIVNIDAGSGDDWVWFASGADEVTLTLGGGRDVIDPFSNLFSLIQSSGTVVVNDWEAGPTGDVFDVTSLLAGSTGLGGFMGWDPTTNPFTAGYLRLTQSGGDVLLGFSSTPFGAFTDFIQFKNTNVAAFTAENFGGYSPDGATSPDGTVTGTGAASEILTGGSGDDLVEGLGGTDWIWAGMGADVVRGGDGADVPQRRRRQRPARGRRRR